MPARLSRRVLIGQLMGIVLIALSIRLWGIDFGLPYGQIPDETTDVTQSFQIVKGELPPYPFHRVTWSLFQLPVHGAHFAALKLANPQFNLSDFEARYYTNRSLFLLSSRLTMAILCALCVLPMYSISAELTGRHIGGVIAALVVAMHPSFVYLSHTGLPDALSVLFATLCLWAALRIADTGRPRWYFLGGLFAALTLLIRLQMAPIGAALLGAHFLYSIKQPAPRTRLLAIRWLWIILGGLIGLAVFNPVAVLNPAAALKDIQFILGERLVGSNQNDPHAQTSLLNSFYNIQHNLILPIIFMRPIVILGAILGIAMGIIRRDGRILIVLLVALFALPILTSPDARITYWLGLVVPCAVLVSYGLVGLTSYPRARSVAVIGGVLILGWCAVEALKIDTVLSQPTTQEAALDYISSSWPSDARILLGDPFVYSVPLPRTRESMERMGTLQEMPASYTFFLEHPDLLRAPLYDVYGSEYRTGLTSDEAMMQFLVDHKIEYVVELDWCQAPVTYDKLSDLTFPLVTPAVRESLTLEATFSPFYGDDCAQFIDYRTHMDHMGVWDWQRPGPIIRLYSVKSN